MTRILVVDDDAMVCTAIELCLKRKGFEVVATDGRDTGLHALEVTTFDLMLIDVFMPHLRGSDAIRIFHERAPATPLIAMSGYAFADLDSANPDFVKVAFEHGASGCLRKPFTPAKLWAAIDACLAKSTMTFQSLRALQE
jgi:CheY-like chemotaxis protein